MVCLFGVLLFAMYEADLTTRMTVQPRDNPLRSFEDIYRSEYQLIVIAASAQAALLKDGKEGSIWRKLRETMGPGHFVSLAECHKECMEELLKVIMKLSGSPSYGD